MNKKEELIKKIANSELSESVFCAKGVYFTISKSGIREISGDIDTPMGGSINLVEALSKEEHDTVEKIFKKYGIESDFFGDNIEDEDGIAWEDEDFLDMFEYDDDAEEKTKIIKKMYDDIQAKKFPYESLSEFSGKIIRYDLEEDTSYYWWEGEFRDIKEDILYWGEDEGEYESFTEEEWIDILSHIENYIAW